MEILKIFRGIFSRVRGLLGYIVHQIMDVEYVAAGKDAGNGGFQTFIDEGAVCGRSHPDAKL